MKQIELSCILTVTLSAGQYMISCQEFVPESVILCDMLCDGVSCFGVLVSMLWLQEQSSTITILAVQIYQSLLSKRSTIITIKDDEQVFHTSVVWKELEFAALIRASLLW